MMNNQQTIDRLVGVVRHLDPNGVYCHVTNVAMVDGHTWLRNQDYLPSDQRLPRIGDWVEYDLVDHPRGPRAANAVPCSLGIDEKMRRLLRQYGDAMLDNHGSLRLDGLTRLESKEFKERGIIGLRDYYACMSENGLRQVAIRWRVDYEAGDRIKVARRIVDAIERNDTETADFSRS